MILNMSIVARGIGLGSAWWYIRVHDQTCFSVKQKKYECGIANDKGKTQDRHFSNRQRRFSLMMKNQFKSLLTKSFKHRTSQISDIYLDILATHWSIL